MEVAVNFSVISGWSPSHVSGWFASGLRDEPSLSDIKTVAAAAPGPWLSWKMGSHTSTEGPGGSDMRSGTLSIQAV
jgi:hypothetical protein